MPAIPSLPRRELIFVGAAGVGLAALSACSSDASGGSTAAESGGSSGSAAPESSAAGGAGAAGGGAPLVKLDDIKVGESAAATNDGQDILVTRTGEDTAVAFSATCTHQGCKVAPAGKELHCPCHGSKYDAATGKVLAGPAPKPLPEVKVTVTDGEVVAG